MTGQKVLPEWREHPASVIEGVFFVTEGDGYEVAGDAKFRQGPIGDERSIAVKGDYAPLFETCVMGCEVLTDVYGALKRSDAAEEAEPGTILARFHAENIDSGWQLSYEHDSVARMLLDDEFATMEVAP